MFVPSFWSITIKKSCGITVLRHRERNVRCTFKIAVWFKSGWSLSRSFKWVLERDIFSPVWNYLTIWLNTKVTIRFSLTLVNLQNDRSCDFHLSISVCLFEAILSPTSPFFLTVFSVTKQSHKHRLVSCLCSPVKLFLCGKTAGREDETEKVTLKFIFFPRDIKTLSIQRESFSSKRQHGSIY